MEFKDKIKKMREIKGLTRKELADKSGISYPYLCQVESGSRPTPKPLMLRKLADGLGCPVDDLMKAAGYLESKEEPLDLEILLLKNIKYRGQLLTIEDKEFILNSLKLLFQKEEKKNYS